MVGRKKPQVPWLLSATGRQQQHLRLLTIFSGSLTLDDHRWCQVSGLVFEMEHEVQDLREDEAEISVSI